MHDIKKKIKYWFDNQLHNGVFGLVKFLLIITIIFIVILIILNYFLYTRFSIENSEHWTEATFTALPTVINGSLPTFADNDYAKDIKYLVMMSTGALFGVFFASIFIGLITEAIQQNLMDIKDNNTNVYEKNHLIILGYNENIFPLLREIIMGNEKKKTVIVVASAESCDEMRNQIYSNLKVPKNIKMVFRTLNINNVNDLQKLSIETSKRVILNLTSNRDTARILLSLDNLYSTKNINNVQVFGLLYRDKYGFLENFKNKNFAIFELNKIMAKLIARSSKSFGIANIYREIFTFENNELYVEKIDEFTGKTFYDAVMSINDAIPIGVIIGEKQILNPNKDFVLGENDKLIMFEKDKYSYSIPKNKYYIEKNALSLSVKKNIKKKCVVFGENETINIIISQIKNDFDECEVIKNKDILYKDTNSLIEKVQKCNSAIILNNHKSATIEREDMSNIFFMKKLTNIRRDMGFDFSITLELSENKYEWNGFNQNDVDFVIASCLHSELLAQISEKNEILDIYRELLNADGNEFNEKLVSEFGLIGEYKVYELRSMLAKLGCIFVGIFDKNVNKFRYLMDLNESIVLNKDDSIVIISEN